MLHIEPLTIFMLRAWLKMASTEIRVLWQGKRDIKSLLSSESDSPLVAGLALNMLTSNIGPQGQQYGLVSLPVLLRLSA